MLGKNHPLTRTALGYEEGVRTFGASDLESYHKRNFGASNSRLYLVGAVPENFAEIARRHFENKERGVKLHREFPYMESFDDRVVLSFNAPDLLNQTNPEENNSEVRVDVIVPPRNHPDFAILKLLGSVIGGGSNSRMFQALSRRKGLAYRVSGGYFGGDNFGDIYVRGNFLARRTEEAIDTIFEEFERIKSEGVTEVELDAKKKGANYMIAKSFETNRSRLEMIRDVLTFGTNPEQFYREIAEASSERIVEIARKYLPSSREGNGYGILIRNPLM